VLTNLLDPVLNWHGLTVYLVVGALVFAEAAIFLGFVFPGETAVVLGGVIASRGNVQLEVLMAVVVVAAIVGDTVGYTVGRTLGPRLLEAKLLRKRRRSLDRAVEYVRRRGAFAVFFGRFTAFLRAVVPGLAGASGMHYPTFLAANAAGGLIWGTLFCLLGYLAGNAYKTVEHYASWASYALLALVVVGYAVVLVRSRRKERAFEEGADEPGADEEGADEPDAVEASADEQGDPDRPATTQATVTAGGPHPARPSEAAVVETEPPQST